MRSINVGPSRGVIDEDIDMTEHDADTGDPDATNPAEPEVHAPANDVPAGTSKDLSSAPSSEASTASRRMSVSFSARGLVFGALIVILAGAAAAFAWLYLDGRRQIDAQAREAGNNTHAEKIALDYAVNAAAMNFQDLDSWKVRLVAGTSPELNGKLTQAAESMKQILVPLQWTSTAKPLAAKALSNNGGVYVVDCFVGVETKTVQAPDALQSTATYSVTIDSTKNWQITDVGGIGAVAGQK